MSERRDLQALALDDEPLALQLLSSLLEDAPDIELVASCARAEQAIEIIHEQTIDLVFLDIQMPEINGFEFVRRIQPEIFPHIIFTTAFEQYALDAFRVHAVDYLLKPLDEGRLYAAVQKAKQLEHRKFEGALKQQIIAAADLIAHRMGRVAQENLPQVAEKITVHERTPGLTLAVKERGHTRFIMLSEILWLEAAGDYVLIHTNGSVHSLRETMRAIEAKLDPALFARVHRSTIINKSYIDEIAPLQKGEAQLRLRNGVTIKVSRSYRQNIRDIG